MTMTPYHVTTQILKAESMELNWRVSRVILSDTSARIDAGLSMSILGSLQKTDVTRYQVKSASKQRRSPVLPLWLKKLIKLWFCIYFNQEKHKTEKKWTENACIFNESRAQHRLRKPSMYRTLNVYQYRGPPLLPLLSSLTLAQCLLGVVDRNHWSTISSVLILFVRPVFSTEFPQRRADGVSCG